MGGLVGAVLNSALPTGKQPNQTQGCCAECYSNVLATQQNTNPVTVNSDLAVQLAQPNPQRKESIITVCGAQGNIFIGLGRQPTATSYDIALVFCTFSDNDATGGVWINDIWQGSIWAISDNDGALVSIVEMV